MGSLKRGPAGTAPCLAVPAAVVGCRDLCWPGAFFRDNTVISSIDRDAIKHAVGEPVDNISGLVAFGLAMQVFFATDSIFFVYPLPQGVDNLIHTPIGCI